MSVERRLLSIREEGRAVVFGLVDPAKGELSRRAARNASEAGVDAFLVGGSTAVDRESLDEVIEELRSLSGAPIILFPGNVNGLTPKADAVLFMSLLNSEDPYYIIGAQVQGAPLIRKYGLEALPTAYLVLHGDSAVSHVGRARELPPGRPELVAMYAMAAWMLGMRFLYLEGGSGSSRHVEPEAVSAARSVHGGFIIAGGGLRTPEAVSAVVSAGADGIVLGTALETMGPEDLRALVGPARRGRSR